MALVYFEPDDLKKLSDVELIRKQQQIVEMVSNASKRSTIKNIGRSIYS